MEINVNMGEGVSNLTTQCNSTFTISSSFETPTIDNSTTLPPFQSPLITSLPQSSQSPIFENILNQTITTLLQSQSTEVQRTNPADDATDDGEFMGSFADIKFDPEEENKPDHMLMSEKQFNILNRKLTHFYSFKLTQGVEIWFLASK